MDFTQHNKINSCLPSPNRAVDCRQQPSKNFSPIPPQYQKYAPAPSYPTFQQQQQQQHQQQNFQRNQMMQPQMQQIGDGGGRCYQPSYGYNQQPQMMNMNCCMGQVIKSHEMDQHMGVDEQQMVSMGEDSDDIKIEFFQCSKMPSASQRSKSPSPRPNSSYHPNFEQNCKYSEKNFEQKPIENHQTYFYTHNDEDAESNGTVDSNKKENDEESKEEVVNHQNSYKSRTKIIQIPNGVRIVTDIIRNGECANDLFKNFRQLSSPPSKDKWPNKFNIILDDERNDKRSNCRVDGNSSKNEADDDYYEDRKSLI